MKPQPAERCDDIDDIAAMHDETTVEEHRELVRLGREIIAKRQTGSVKREETWYHLLRGTLTWILITLLGLAGAGLSLAFKLVSFPWLPK